METTLARNNQTKELSIILRSIGMNDIDIDLLLEEIEISEAINHYEQILQAKNKLVNTIIELLNSSYTIQSIVLDATIINSTNSINGLKQLEEDLNQRVRESECIRDEDNESETKTLLHNILQNLPKFDFEVFKLIQIFQLISEYDVESLLSLKEKILNTLAFHEIQEQTAVDALSIAAYKTIQNAARESIISEVFQPHRKPILPSSLNSLIKGPFDY